MRNRFFQISTQFNDKDGNEIINQEIIEEAITKHIKSIKSWAWCIHDEDTYCDADKINWNKKEKEKEKNAKKKGEVYEKRDFPYTLDALKPAHFHIILHLNSPYDVEIIAKWFGLPAHMVEAMKGRNSFEEGVLYLTHEDAKQQDYGKHLYSRNIIHSSIENIDNFLDDYISRRLNEGEVLTPRERLRNAVLFEGKTLLSCRREFPDLYRDDLNYLEKLRGDYLCRQAKTPNFRINYYVEGDGGIGKNTACKALARQLAFTFGLADEDTDMHDIVFQTGGENVSFDGYDGQPVIIWNDKRAVSLIKQFGRDETYDIFDVHPTDSFHNVKYGKIKLINAINIVNGPEPYITFLDGLAGEYTDKSGEKVKSEMGQKGQAYRRFPIIMCLREKDFDVMFNKGVFNNTREYTDFIGYRNIVGNFAKVAMVLEDKAAEKIYARMVEAPCEGAIEMKRLHDEKLLNEDKSEIDFSRYGLIEDEEAELDAYLEDGEGKACFKKTQGLFKEQGLQ